MRHPLITWLFLVHFSLFAQDALEEQLEDLFIEKAHDDHFAVEVASNIGIVNSWGKEETFSSFIHMKSRLRHVHSPIFVFVIDGGDLYETDNIIAFMNSVEGRSFRTFANYLVLDKRTLTDSKNLHKKFANDNLFLVENNFSIIAQTTIDLYQVKKSQDWWEALKIFTSKNLSVIRQINLKMKTNIDQELLKTLENSLDKLKNAAFKERKKAVITMRGLVAEIGFFLFPETISADPEVSLTIEALLLSQGTKLSFPVLKTIPLHFDLEQQLILLSQK